LAVPFADLGLAADQPVAFFVAVFDDAGASSSGIRRIDRLSC
jgi:hypothetical protein